MSAADDRELERYLQRGDALSRAYAALKSERPSPALDQAVLARARDALQGRSRALRHRRWPALTALAATVLVSFALVMRIALEPESRPEQSAAPSPLEARGPVIESEIRAVAEQAPPTVEPAAPPAALEERARTDSAAVQTGRAAAPPDRDAAFRAFEPHPAQDSRQPPSELAEEPARMHSLPVTTQPAAVPAPATPTTGVLSADQSMRSKSETAKSPQAWLREIEELRAAGRMEAAEAELERFRAAYPGYLETRTQQVTPAQR